MLSFVLVQDKIWATVVYQLLHGTGLHRDTQLDWVLLVLLGDNVTAWAEERPF